jgi:hypothetical protein
MTPYSWYCRRQCGKLAASPRGKGFILMVMLVCLALLCLALTTDGHIATGNKRYFQTASGVSPITSSATARSNAANVHQTAEAVTQRTAAIPGMPARSSTTTTMSTTPSGSSSTAQHYLRQSVSRPGTPTNSNNAAAAAILRASMRQQQLQQQQQQQQRQQQQQQQQPQQSTAVSATHGVNLGRPGGTHGIPGHMGAWAPNQQSIVGSSTDMQTPVGLPGTAVQSAAAARSSGLTGPQRPVSAGTGGLRLPAGGTATTTTTSAGSEKNAAQVGSIVSSPPRQPVVNIVNDRPVVVQRAVYRTANNNPSIPYAMLPPPAHVTISPRTPGTNAFNQTMQINNTNHRSTSTEIHRGIMY